MFKPRICSWIGLLPLFMLSPDESPNDFGKNH